MLFKVVRLFRRGRGRACHMRVRYGALLGPAARTVYLRAAGVSPVR